MIDINKFHDALGNVWKMFPQNIVNMNGFQDTVRQIADLAVDLYNAQEDQRTYKEMLEDIASDLKKEWKVEDD